TTHTATLVPMTALSSTATYTLTLSGAKDLAGNTMSSVSWSFATASSSTSATIWDSAATPAVASASDSAAVELGIKFRSDVSGFIAALRFYKGAGNTGTHVGHLWDAAGNLLATATFSGESATGWQQVTFTSPVAVAANTTYVASYYAPNGGYSYTGAYFASAGVDSGQLHPPSDAAAGGNGVYRYITGGGFPTNSYNATNYWVDVIFSTSLRGTWLQTNAADFAAGTATGTVVTNDSGGELQMQPVFADHFSGSA